MRSRYALFRKTIQESLDAESSDGNHSWPGDATSSDSWRFCIAWFSNCYGNEHHRMQNRAILLQCDRPLRQVVEMIVRNFEAIGWRSMSIILLFVDFVKFGTTSSGVAVVWTSEFTFWSAFSRRFWASGNLKTHSFFLPVYILQGWPFPQKTIIWPLQGLKFLGIALIYDNPCC